MFKFNWRPFTLLQPSGDITRACDALARAHTALCSPTPSGDLASALVAINALAEDAIYELRGAQLALGDSIAHVCVDAGRQSNVPSDSVRALQASWEQRARLVAVCKSVQAFSSYAWAGKNNMAHRDAILPTGGPVVVVHSGRFRPGYDGRDPDEKQVDTLCAVACLERTQAAIAAGGSRAVIVMSDDDDLTPALCAAAALTTGTDVRVVVAGTAVVHDRFRDMPMSTRRPRWLVLDQHAWHRAVGLDPVAAACTRHQLARLALGSPLPFDTSPDGKRLAVTHQGLKVKLASTVGTLPAVLGLDHLEWRSGRDKASQVPRAVVGPGVGQSPGQVVRCEAPQGTRLAMLRLPVTDPRGGPEPLHVRLSAPGWWMANDELVVAKPDTGGGDSWRVVGPNSPRTLEDLAGVTRGQVMRLTARQATWATVKLPGQSVTVLVPDGTGLHVGDEIAVVAYERVASGPPARALLISSAL